jgi:GrpB-like predicted nucleotidyltransferase (UPF0157 family)
MAFDANNKASHPVRVVDYDPRWPQLYAEEEKRLRAAIGRHLLALEHAGSTSVPGLAAKPTIDILAGVRSLDEAQACIAPLEALGYEYNPEFEDTMPERRYFRLMKDEEHLVHIHMVEITSEFWRTHLLFRDYLRAHPETARAYGELKRALAQQYGPDRDGYTDAKADFIQGVIAAAAEWQRDS